MATYNSMDKHNGKHARATSTTSEEVSSIKWEFINMTGQEEDLISRMYRLVGDRWDLIAGRIPGRKAEEIERYWIMKQWKMYANSNKSQGQGPKKV